MLNKYDIIVIGAGHAGCEAAAAAANLGSKVLLISMDMNKFAQMSCNPAMGGIAKGQLIREIDALGGYSGIITDITTIQFRMLNRSKGPAMWSPRAQCDRVLFSIEWRKILESIKNLYFWQDTVVNFIFKDNSIIGVQTKLGLDFFSSAVIITSGTFLNGVIHVGNNQLSGGRASEMSSQGLSEQLNSFGVEVGRMKTGTPPRIDGRSLDFSKFIEQKGENGYERFSFAPIDYRNLPQQSCYLVHTNIEVHNILKEGFKESPLFNGIIQGIGPRYCPSIETKLVTFPDKEQHQLFIEPEGIGINEFYLNGFSSSLSATVQLNALKLVKGFENIRLFRPGYAIEYDYFPPHQLKHTLESKILKNLFFAGQVNGTTGYEEAAAQGLMAGINAHHLINGIPGFILNRDEAYIGVLIDDLVTKSVDEPYRMFTSRAEYRVLLRQDNADFRLTKKGYDIGLVPNDKLNIFEEKKAKTNELLQYMIKTSIKPEEINGFLDSIGSARINQSIKLATILSRPDVTISSIALYDESLKSKLKFYNEYTVENFEQVEIQIKYAGYIEREQIIANKLNRLEYISLSEDFDYDSINSLSTEARQKLLKYKPSTIGAASRISGISPSDINILLIFLGR